MLCPLDHVELRTENYKGIEVDRCPTCKGMWLDYGELDQLEDKVYDSDLPKGTLMIRSFETELECPKCSKKLRKFNYRAYDLELDFCDDGHGVWLDGGEEKRVEELMKQRVKNFNRKTKAEQDFAKFLSGLRSPSFVDKMKGLFRK